jgi:NitT/TauT family transport system permease protein
LRSIDKKYLELAEIYRLSLIKTFFNIKLPFILPSFVSTTLTALGFAWKSGIAAEVLCRPDVSLGTMLQEAKIYISTPDVFALTAVVAILSLILEAVIKKLLRRYSDDKNR